MKIPPLKPIDGYQAVSIIESGEPLVPLAENNKLKAGNFYYKEKVNGAIDVCYIRQTVNSMLISVANSLPENYVLVVNDGWRPFEVQLAIYDSMFGILKKRHPDYSDDELHKETSKYAAKGSLDPQKPSPHFTGGSVDVILVNNEGVQYNMGSVFDESSPESGTRFFEEKLEGGIRLNQKEEEALYNRRILFSAMAGAGFTNYLNEWWHYDFGNQIWAKIKGKNNAIYGLSEKSINY